MEGKLGCAHVSADCLGGGLVVAGDNDDADAGRATGGDGGGRLRARWVVHAH